MFFILLCSNHLSKRLKPCVKKLNSMFFNDELHLALDKQLSDPKLIANLLNGIVNALEKME